MGRGMVNAGIRTMSLGIQQIFNDPTLASLKITLDAASIRHSALASNVANANTPGYQRVDLSPSFKATFDAALRQIDQGTPVNQVELPQGQITVQSVQNQARYDGNTVNMDQEMTELIKNQTDFDFSAQVLAINYAGLRAAITGKT